MNKDYAKNRNTPYRARTAARPVPGWVFMLIGLFMGALVVGAIWLKEQSLKMHDEKGAALLQDSAGTIAAAPAPSQTDAAKPRFDFYTLLPNNEAGAAEPSLTEEESEDTKLLEEAARLAKAEKENPVPIIETPMDETERLAKRSSDVPLPEAALNPPPLPSLPQVPTAITPVEPDDKVQYPIGSYLVQAGSFRQFAEADAMKASLVLMGFDQPRLHSVELRPGEKWYRVMIGPFTTEQEARRLTERLSSEQIRGAIVLRVRS